MKKRLSLEDLKVSSFVTNLKSDEVLGGLRWQSALTCPDECASDGCSIPCSIGGCQGTAYCESDQYPTACVFTCN